MVEQNVSRDGTQVSPWWNKNYSVAEQNFLHGGTDWFLHAFCLILIEETLEDALWRER